ncbi:MAG TPA: 2-nitropropane dioxygenase, partial [Richelia sp.]|nr:2-nitropropane dioxygenase [Richelia sp.]
MSIANVLLDNGLRLTSYHHTNQTWKGSLEKICFTPEAIKKTLLTLHKPCYVVRTNDKIGITNDGYISPSDVAEVKILMATPPIFPQQLGDCNFLSFHGVKCAYATGAMANGIASADMIIALGKAKILASFGAGGLPIQKIEAAIQHIQKELPQGPYAFNLIHSPHEPSMERCVVDLYLKYGVKTIEASAFLE